MIRSSGAFALLTMSAVWLGGSIARSADMVPAPTKQELVSLPSMATEEERQLDTPSVRQRHRWVWDSLLALRYNPRGAIARVRAGYRMQLWDRPGVLYEQSFASLKGAVDLTPAYARVGGVLELQPIAALRLWARYDYVSSFGDFSYTQSFDDPRADHSDTTVQRQSDRDYATKGGQVTLAALLQLKFGPIAARTQFEAAHGWLDIHAGDRVFYDGYFDTLFPNGGWGAVSETDLLYLHDSGFKLMLRYSYSHVFYRSRDYALQPEQQPNSPTHRLGPALLYTFFEDRPGAAYDAPTVAFLSQWWLGHRYRTGADSDPALPFMLLVFMQRGDLL
ncbi:MAG: hypothetical protein VB934_07230 [Polyangiaceae bacterium]